LEITQSNNIFNGTKGEHKESSVVSDIE